MEALWRRSTLRFQYELIFLEKKWIKDDHWTYLQVLSSKRNIPNNLILSWGSWLRLLHNLSWECTIPVSESLLKSSYIQLWVSWMSSIDWTTLEHWVHQVALYPAPDRPTNTTPGKVWILVCSGTRAVISICGQDQCCWFQLSDAPSWYPSKSTRTVKDSEI